LRRSGAFLLKTNAQRAPRRPEYLKGPGGTIDTPGLSDLLDSSEAGAERRKMIISIVPLGRFGTPDEIAAKRLYHP
jgi:hypothetical protein